MELAHLPYRMATVEEHVSMRGLKRHGKKMA